MVETEVMVASAQKNLLSERMRLCSMLWDADIKAEMAYKRNPHLLNQFQYCEKEGVPFQILVGEEELKADSVKIRDAETKEEASYSFNEQHMTSRKIYSSCFSYITDTLDYAVRGVCVDTLKSVVFFVTCSTSCAVLLAASTLTDTGETERHGRRTDAETASKRPQIIATRGEWCTFILLRTIRQCSIVL